MYRVAQKHGLKLQQSILPKAFDHHFKKVAAKAPNFGSGICSTEQWWSEIIKGTVLEAAEHPIQEEDKSVDAITRELVQLFSTQETYKLYPETKMVLTNLRYL